MAVVTGDRYLDSLVRFVERNTGPLLEGTLTLKLNPVGLRYVQSRLEALEELERLRAGAPVDYLRAYVSDLGDHRALEQLRRILRLLPSLKVISVLPTPARDPTPLSLLPFGRMKVLELRGCDLSSSTARGLLELRHTLEKLVCHNSTNALRHLFASSIIDIKDSPAWKRLSFVSCACNGLVLMDEALQLLPAVETLDLSRNQFAKVDNLRKCTKLRHLDLGFNHLRTIASLSEVLCPIIKLVLRNNALTTLRGIENLKFVEGLDLSYNMLSTFSELEILASLPSLHNVWLEGNPICCARWSRAHVFSFFSRLEKVKLDEKGINTREYWERRVILSSRQKHPAGYGFYFPAEENATADGCSNTKRKKVSRLASIEDEEQRRYFCAENVEQESASCDSDNMKKDETVITDSEAEITDLMNRVEFMKKEQSVLWLRDFREWMDQAKEDSLYVGKCMESNINTDAKYTEQRKGKEHLGKFPAHVMDTLRSTKGECSTNFLDPAQVQLEVSCNGPLNSVPLGKKDFVLSTSLMFEGGKETEGRRSTSSLAAIEETMEFHQSSLNPRSPPHYQEDILQRRQNLEDDFLQLSIESCSLSSSDSDTSCSDDDSCKFNDSFSEFNNLLIEDSVKRSISAHSPELQLDNGPQDARERDMIRSIADTSAESHSIIQESSMPNHREPFPMYGMDDPSSSNVKIPSNDLGVRRKGNLKPKRRAVTLLEENSLAANIDIMSKVSNGILKVHKADVDDDGYDLPNCGANSPDGLQDEVQKRLVWNPDPNNTPSTSSEITFMKEKSRHSCVSDASIEKYFLKNLAESSVAETCEGFICCNCILEEGSDYQEREVAIVLSNKQKLYVLHINVMCDRAETSYKVLGCHRLEEIKELVIGLDLQALRIQVEGGTSYMLLVRSAEKLENLLCLFRVCDSSAAGAGYSIKSWDQVQVELFDNHVFGGLKASIFLYSLLLFWHDKCEGESWVSRSLFLVEGYMLVCFENLVDFGKSTDDVCVSAPYFSLDSCCPIENILEMVIEPKETRCLTLTLEHITRGKNCIVKSQPGHLIEKTVHVFTWRLKWFSEEKLLKFVALLKAIHGGLTSSPLHVKCMS